MLQRAASNAYSWWWASHIRTKQSKWLEQNLQDMEEKVQNVLHLLQEDGDSFAKRAEMYYKKRPELINFVEETYRAYRALAERYEKISTDLQNANTTIASVFPEQVQFSMDDDEDDGSVPNFKHHGKDSEASKLSIPKVPAPPKKNLKSLLTTATRNLQSNKGSQRFKKVPAKSGLTEGQAVAEIDKLQKEILTLQTEKEFVKSSYENKLARYYDMDREISEMQERISSLQDEFDVGLIIEDDEARTLMASTALKSCQDTLTLLEEKQGQSSEDATTEQQKIADASRKLENGKTEMPPYNGLLDNISPEAVSAGQSNVGDPDTLKNEEITGPLSITDMAEKIDELVQKVISLETQFSSQTAHVTRLRNQADELQKQVFSLEADKTALIDGTNSLNKKLREMEDKSQQVLALGDIDKLLQEMEEKSQQVLPSDDNNQMLHGAEEKSLHVLPSENNDQMLHEGEEKSLQVPPSDNNDQMLHKAEEKSPQVLPSENNDQMLHEAEEKSLQVFASDDIDETLHEAKEKSMQARTSDSNNDKKDEPDNSDIITSQLQSFDTLPGAPLGALNPEINEFKSADTKTDQDNKADKLAGGMMSGAVENGVDNASSQMKEAADEDEVNWQELFRNGLQDKEKVILKEYTTTLRNYKDLKKKLTEVEKKNNDTLLEFVSQIRELRSAVSKKDEEIQSLCQKLSFLKDHTDSAEQPTLDGKISKQKEEIMDSTATEIPEVPPASGVVGDQDNADNDRVLKEILSSKNLALSPIEEKFRSNIDELLEENLNFWLRFSSAFHQIQKFQTEVEDLQAELAKIEEKKTGKQESSSSKHRNLKSDVLPIYKHLSEINTEISVWLEQSVLLKEELGCRFSSLCNIQDEISAALVATCGEIEEAMFTSYQAAKFQGEILNMKQENNKVDNELQSAIDHATRVQLEIEKTLTKLDEDYKISENKSSRPNQPKLTHSESRNRVPLQSFIFGVKPKKQRYSIFSVMHPAMLKRHHDLKSGL